MDGDKLFMKSILSIKIKGSTKNFHLKINELHQLPFKSFYLLESAPPTITTNHVYPSSSTNRPDEMSHLKEIVQYLDAHVFHSHTSQTAFSFVQEFSSVL